MALARELAGELARARAIAEQYLQKPDPAQHVAVRRALERLAGIPLRVGDATESAWLVAAYGDEHVDRILVEAFGPDATPRIHAFGRGWRHLWSRGLWLGDRWSGVRVRIARSAPLKRDLVVFDLTAHGGTRPGWSQPVRHFYSIRAEGPALVRLEAEGRVIPPSWALGVPGPDSRLERMQPDRIVELLASKEDRDVLEVMVWLAQGWRIDGVTRDAVWEHEATERRFDALARSRNPWVRDQVRLLFTVDD